jgi:translation initiation factor IF-3
MAKPPVCKLMDYGKFKYESALKAREDRKKQVNTVIKEMKLRPKIDAHDYETKKGHVVRFLKAGDKVKITIMFRGREQSRPELGFRLLKKLADDVADIAFVEYSPKQDGRNMIMVLGPVKKKAEAMAEAQAEKDAKKGRRHDEADGDLEATESSIENTEDIETTTDVTEPAPAEVETVETIEPIENAETVETPEAAQAEA